MREARVLGPLIGVERKPQLLDAAQTLKLGRVDQTHHQLSFAAIGAKTDDVMDRIAVDTFRHALWKLSRPAKELNELRPWILAFFEALWSDSIEMDSTN